MLPTAKFEQVEQLFPESFANIVTVDRRYSISVQDTVEWLIKSARFY
jgi:hypothetical protein